MRFLWSAIYEFPYHVHHGGNGLTEWSALLRASPWRNREGRIEQVATRLEHRLVFPEMDPTCSKLGACATLNDLTKPGLP